MDGPSGIRPGTTCQLSDGEKIRDRFSVVICRSSESTLKAALQAGGYRRLRSRGSSVPDGTNRCLVPSTEAGSPQKDDCQRYGWVVSTQPPPARGGRTAMPGHWPVEPREETELLEKRKKRK